MRSRIVMLSILVFSLGACMKKGEVKSKESLPGENLSVYNGNQNQANSLAFDGAFIDFAYYQVNSLGASQYVHSKLGSYSDGFFNAIKTCSDESCTNGLLADVGLDGNILDDYYFSSIAAGIILRIDRPELDRLSPANRDQLFRTAFQIGINSGDARWNSVKSRLIELTNYFPRIIQYKTDPDWTDYANCVVSSMGAAFGAVMGLGAIVEAVKTGNVAKAIKSIKTFVRSGLGRAAGFIGVALIGWDIFKCCWDLAHPDSDSISKIPGKKVSEKYYFVEHFNQTI